MVLRRVWWRVWVCVLVARQTPRLVLGSMIALTLWFLTMILAASVVVTRCRCLMRVRWILGMVSIRSIVVSILGAWTLREMLWLLMSTRGLAGLAVRATAGAAVRVVMVLVLVGLTLRLSTY